MIDKGVAIFKNPIEDKENGYLIDKVDINKLIRKTILADKQINGIVLTDKRSTIILDEEDDDKSIKYNMVYKDDKIIISGAIYKGNKEITNIKREIDVETLVDQISDTMRNNINKTLNVTSLPLVLEALEDIKDQIYKSSFENNIMLTREEYNYRINIYSAMNDTLIGVANRVFIENGSLILMEAIFYDTSYISEVNVKVILDEENVVEFNGLNLESSSGKSIKYCSFSLFDSTVVKNKENNKADKLNLKGLKLPYKNTKTKVMEDELLMLNNQNTLIKCYKLNKCMNIKKININKYLLS